MTPRSSSQCCVCKSRIRLARRRSFPSAFLWMGPAVVGLLWSRGALTCRVTAVGRVVRPLLAPPPPHARPCAPHHASNVCSTGHLSTRRLAASRGPTGSIRAGTRTQRSWLRGRAIRMMAPHRAAWPACLNVDTVHTTSCGRARLCASAHLCASARLSASARLGRRGRLGGSFVGGRARVGVRNRLGCRARLNGRARLGSRAGLSRYVSIFP